MYQVYISGPLTGISNLSGSEQLKSFYEAIALECHELGLAPYLPHQNETDPEENPDLPPREVYELDKLAVINAELVIAYVGLASIGVGMELGWADAWGIPVILLYEKGKTISRLPRGIPDVIEIEFESYDQALKDLRRTLLMNNVN